MKRAIYLLLMCTALPGLANEVAEGRAKAEVACALCHGLNGVSTLPNAPNLAGQQSHLPERAVEELPQRQAPERSDEHDRQAADGTRKSTHLSLWFSSIKVTVEGALITAPGGKPSTSAPGVVTAPSWRAP